LRVLTLSPRRYLDEISPGEHPLFGSGVTERAVVKMWQRCVFHYVCVGSFVFYLLNMTVSHPVHFAIRITSMASHDSTAHMYTILRLFALVRKTGRAANHLADKYVFLFSFFVPLGVAPPRPPARPPISMHPPSAYLYPYTFEFSEVNAFRWGPARKFFAKRGTFLRH
jgi:hypothetical protein